MTFFGKESIADPEAASSRWSASGHPVIGTGMVQFNQVLL